MRLKIFYITLVSLFLLAACNTSDDASPAEQTDVKEMVNEYSAGNFGDEQASITSTELIIQENDEEKRYELPENEFFVSIAPFINQTHPCGDHSLTGCQGDWRMKILRLPLRMLTETSFLMKHAMLEITDSLTYGFQEIKRIKF